MKRYLAATAVLTAIILPATAADLVGKSRCDPTVAGRRTSQSLSGL